MKLERRHWSRLTVPIKALADRFTFATLIALSIGLLLLSKADVGALHVVTARIGDALAPVLSVLAEPIGAPRRLVENIHHLVAVYGENTRLRAQNEQLLEWRQTAHRLALQNAALRQLLDVEVEAAPTAVAARIVADAGGPFVQTVLVNAGSVHGVAQGMAAVNEHGLVGRIIDVGRRSARLLLLTDFNSKVPAMVEPSRDQAILAGNNTDQPELIFLPVTPHLSVGDRVVTSGRGGVLPPGLTIGVVRTISDRRVTVTPMVDWTRLDHVRLLDYAPVLPPAALAELQREIYGPPRPPAAALRDDGSPAAQSDSPPEAMPARDALAEGGR